MFAVTGAALIRRTRLAFPMLVLGLALSLGLAQAAAPDTTPSADPATAIIVVGAPGQEEFARDFADWTGFWEKACRQSGVKWIVIGLTNSDGRTDHDRLQEALSTEPKETSAQLWLVLLGHGTFDGKEAKFNVRGPDVSASELADWLKPFRRPVALIDTSSASAPFLNKLSAPGRVILTATRSGHEVNFARLGQYLSEAVADPEADLDKDGQTSLLEAYLMASRRLAEFYKTEGRLATEHALLDDNGDGLGTPPDWFRGIRAVKKTKEDAALDGLRAHQFHLVRSETERQLAPQVRARRDELELAVGKLREVKSGLPEDEYYRQLETLLLEMAKLYQLGASAQK